MWNKLREYLAIKLCPHLVENLFKSAQSWEDKHIESDKLWTKTREERKAFEEMKRVWELTERFKFKEALNVVDLVREKMKGFDPKLVSDGKVTFNGDTGTLEVISDIFADSKLAGYTSETDFLADAKKIHDNRALAVICDYIKKNQIIFTVSAAKNMEQVNFNGGSINGVELVREQVGILNAVFEERHAKEEDFDPHKAV